MTIPTIETLKTIATPQNLAMLKTFATSKLFIWTAAPVVLGFAAYKFYGSKPGMRMRSKLAAGVRDMAQKAYDDCEMMLTVDKLKPAPQKAHTKR